MAVLLPATWIFSFYLAVQSMPWPTLLIPQCVLRMTFYSWYDPSIINKCQVTFPYFILASWHFLLLFLFTGQSFFAFLRKKMVLYCTLLLMSAQCSGSFPAPALPLLMSYDLMTKPSGMFLTFTFLSFMCKVSISIIIVLENSSV